MWFEEKVMRTFRCRLRSVPGTLGRFLMLVGQAGGDVGEIRMIHQGTMCRCSSTVRPAARNAWATT